MTTVIPAVTREGKWWEIEFSLGLDTDPQVTQARRLSDVNQAVIEYSRIARVQLDVIQTGTVTINDVDLRRAGQLISDQQSRARAEMARASHDLAKFVTLCHGLKIPMRDIAYLANISVQRVSQIVRNSK